MQNNDYCTLVYPVCESSRCVISAHLSACVCDTFMCVISAHLSVCDTGVCATPSCVWLLYVCVCAWHRCVCVCVWHRCAHVTREDMKTQLTTEYQVIKAELQSYLSVMLHHILHLKVHKYAKKHINNTASIITASLTLTYLYLLLQQYQPVRSLRSGNQNLLALLWTIRHQTCLTLFQTFSVEWLTLILFKLLTFSTGT